jgi:hypothetical protein
MDGIPSRTTDTVTVSPTWLPSPEGTRQLICVLETYGIGPSICVPSAKVHATFVRPWSFVGVPADPSNR